MRIRHVCMAVLLLFFFLMTASGQGSLDLFIASLEMPCYPPLASQARIQGPVNLRVELAEDGSVSSAEAVDGNPQLKSAALANVRTWRFGAGPGQTPSSRTTVRFEYKLEGKPGWQRCAARVVFESPNKVEIVARPPILNVNHNPDMQR